ncbi:MAG: hypothetical protein K9I69_00105 [Ignavibacteriales bacterium]|nr:hypothetical protein [Ignavibacteriales bacterium]MCF8306577.1 hypothetical protein [Ignavibacteriales bacterium]MCF8316376.1 hypothetical protein [Ignavibacteriales bacterium]MCF8437666.1 hypothetical protein [Ignavibacteriales bacterium]
MRYHVVIRYVAIALLLNTVMMAVSGIVALIYSESAASPLMYSALITLLFALFPMIFIPAFTKITNKEGFLIVVLAWFISCLTGAVPYLLWGGPFTITNAWFESVSGYTTTGSTILTNIEILPKGILFWRASTHWLGGIGIIVFVLSVIQSFGSTEVVLFRSELSSLARDNFHYRAKKAISIIIGVYLVLTLAETIFLIIFGMNLFDAVTHTFATVATGGFSTKNASIAYYDNLGIEITITVFMFFAGMNFGLLFYAATGKFNAIWRSAVVRYYLGSALIGSVISAFSLWGGHYDSLGEALRHSVFQVISIATTTGFATADTAIWAPAAKFILIFFSFQGACSGSTTGGIKVDRIVVFGKAFIREIKSIMFPNAVLSVKMEKNVVNDKLVSQAVLYIVVFLAITAGSTLLLSLMGIGLTEAFTGSVATIGNVGPGMGKIGSLGNYEYIPNAGKYILSLNMLIGRLEIYSFILFFTIGQWRKSITY